MPITLDMQTGSRAHHLTIAGQVLMTDAARLTDSRCRDVVIDGENARVHRNRIDGSPDTAFVHALATGTGKHLITDNDIVVPVGLPNVHGILIEDDESMVNGNRVQAASGTGFDIRLTGDGNRVKSNALFGTGLSDTGAGNVTSDNG